MLGRSAVAVAMLALAPASILAQDLPQSVEAKELTAGGKLIACSLEFTIAFRDQVYRQGAATGVTGSINLWRRDGFFTSFKLVGADIDTGSPVIFPVASAHLFSSSVSGPYKATQIQCEDSRHYCASVGGDAFLEVLADASAGGVIRMAFNRKIGGMDVPVVLSVGPKVVLDSLECAEKLSR